MPKLSMGRGLMAGVLLAALTLPSAAFAVTERNARATVAEARGKIELADRTGVAAEAGDAQSRAREALERAETSIRKDEEKHAVRFAEEADALATLAVATAEVRKLTAERDQLVAAR